MAVRYYLAPMVEIEMGNRRPIASKTMLYRENNSRHSIAKFRDRSWCVCRVEAESNEHTNIEADPDIRLIPFFDANGNYLSASDPVSRVSAANRTAIANFLENRGIPTDWITGSTTIGRVLKFTIGYMNVSQLMGADFLSDLNLSQTVADIPAARRRRIKAWMEGRGIDTGDFTTAMTIRQVLVRIVSQLNLGQVRLGPEEL